MTLKKREKVLMSVTGVAIVIGLLFTFGLDEFVDQLGAQTDALAAVERVYVEALETLQERADIERRYREIESQVPAAGLGKRMDMVFTEEIVGLCRSLGIRSPQLEPASFEEIKDVEDYEFITVRLRTEGNLDTIVNLLKAFQERGLLFREVDLRSNRDQDNILARVTLARMAPVPAETIQARAQERRARRPATRSATSDF